MISALRPACSNEVWCWKGNAVAHDRPLRELLGHHAAFPAPPLLDLARRLGVDGVRPTVEALAPVLTYHVEPRTLEA